MAKVVVDLSHPFSAEIPRWPYFDKPEIVGAHSMAKWTRKNVSAYAGIFMN